MWQVEAVPPCAGGTTTSAGAGPQLVLQGSDFMGGPARLMVHLLYHEARSAGEASSSPQTFCSSAASSGSGTTDRTRSQPSCSQCRSCSAESPGVASSGERALLGAATTSSAAGHPSKRWLCSACRRLAVAMFTARSYTPSALLRAALCWPAEGCLLHHAQSRGE